MIVHGREIGLRLTLEAALNIAKLTPNEDIGEIGTMIGNATFAKQIDLIASFIAYMSEGYEHARAFEDPGYAAREPLTKEEVLTLDMTKLRELQDAAFAAFRSDSETTVEIKPPKKESAPPASA